ncbi:hypothetical protein B0H12DRAFT_1136238 [Mycena haematopus]|nr:hypothetical protein B0H12DRAFT_1136238 [Mycena haematopus]
MLQTPGGPSHGQSMPMVDPPGSQRHPSGYSQPGYGYNSAPRAGPSSFMPPSNRALAHSRSATLLDERPPPPEGRQLRPRPSLSSTIPPPSSTTDRSMSPTDAAYAKSRRHASGRH